VTQVDFPYDVDPRGRTRATDEAEHIRDLVEQVLFTAPGERVNRPAFGSGLLQLVFAPTSDELASATEFLVRGALQQWLGDLITVDGVDVTSEDAALLVRVTYTIRRTHELRVEPFSWGA
jgi:phage baseplate assembly protein W